MTKKVLRWFENNYMKADPGKSHTLLSSNTQRVVHNVPLISSLKKKLLEITFVSELKFEEHISKF